MTLSAVLARLLLVFAVALGAPILAGPDVVALDDMPTAQADDMDYMCHSCARGFMVGLTNIR
jgi:hypothetical protein